MFEIFRKQEDPLHNEIKNLQKTRAELARQQRELEHSLQLSQSKPNAPTANARFIDLESSEPSGSNQNLPEPDIHSLKIEQIKAKRLVILLLLISILLIIPLLRMIFTTS